VSAHVLTEGLNPSRRATRPRRRGRVGGQNVNPSGRWDRDTFSAPVPRGNTMTELLVSIATQVLVAALAALVAALVRRVLGTA
jgi:hypothetical protein